MIHIKDKGMLLRHAFILNGKKEVSRGRMLFMDRGKPIKYFAQVDIISFCIDEECVMKNRF